ncbi:reverse transcriptase-like protein, partial [Campylobacter jejuni]
MKEKDVAFAQLLQSSITSFVDLEDSLAPVAPPNKGSPTIRMDPALLYARLSRNYSGFVMSFDGSAKTEKYGGYGSCSWVLWSLPEWKVVIAANAYLSATTVNEAEYTGMMNGVKAAIAHGAEDLVIVGDSRLAIQQSLGVIACRKETLLALLNTHKELTANLRSVKYLHVVREYNAAADSLATEALESKVSRVILAETRKSELASLNRIQEMIYEPDEDSVDVSSRGAERQVHVLSGSESSKWKTFENFVVDYSSPSAIMVIW